MSTTRPAAAEQPKSAECSTKSMMWQPCQGLSERPGQKSPFVWCDFFRPPTAAKVGADSRDYMDSA